MSGSENFYDMTSTFDNYDFADLEEPDAEEAMSFEEYVETISDPKTHAIYENPAVPNNSEVQKPALPINAEDLADIVEVNHALAVGRAEISNVYYGAFISL